jgi:hypothetical protein
MVGTKKPEKGQKMEIDEKRRHVGHVYNYKKCSNMCRIHIFLYENGCGLNDKMMPDLTIDISKEKCDGPGTCILTGGGGEVGGVIMGRETQQ